MELQAVFAALPSITAVGMASLLPGAGTGLVLKRKDDELVPVLGEEAVTNVGQRMDVLHKRFGDRFAEIALTELVRPKKAVPAGVDLLVERSVEIDSHLESNPETTLGLIHHKLKRICVAVHTLAKAGFREEVIATDHEFFPNEQAGAGDVCATPPGTWLTVLARRLLGDGTPRWHHWLNRRSHVNRLHRSAFNRLLKRYPLHPARLVHSVYATSRTFTPRSRMRYSARPDPWEPRVKSPAATCPNRHLPSSGQTRRHLAMLPDP